MYVLTAENMKKAEETANQNGITFYDMMDMAGTKCSEHICKHAVGRSVSVLCGKGKNGGDGLVIAARLWENGFRHVTVILVDGEISDTLCYKMFVNLKKYPVDIIDYTKNPGGCLNNIEKAEVIVDAVFGIGFKGVLRGNAADIIITTNMNKTAKKYAVDIPSGLTSDGKYNDGQLYFETDETLSMIAYKPVHVMEPTVDYCGKTTIMHLGFSPEYIEPFSEVYRSYTHEEAVKTIHKRNYDDNKGNYGKVLLIEGSRTMTGCVCLSTQAAVETGAGLVIAAFPECIYHAVVPKLTEPVFMPLPNNENGRMLSSASVQIGDDMEKYASIAVGCGIGVDDDTKQIMNFLVKHSKCPLIVDADGINCISENIDILKERKCEIILTPHPGEMARLIEKSVAEIQSDRVGTAMDFAKKYGVTLVLKGANTVVASPDGRVYLNTTGNPGMARGGSGDVLTGIIAALVPQTDDVFTAACTGTYIHGAAGDYTAEKFGMLSATPTRIISNLHGVLSEF